MKAWLPALRSAHYQAQLGNHVAALELISACWPPDDGEGRYHLARLASWAAERISAGQGPRALAARLSLPPAADRALRRERDAEGPAIGVIRVPLVDTASQEGFIAQLEVTRATSRDDVGPDMPPGWRRAIGRAEEVLWQILAKGLVEPKRFGQALRYALRSEAPIEELEGDSAAGAALLAAFSLLCGRELPEDLIVSAELDKEGKLKPVSGLEAKLKAIAREQPVIRRVVAPGARAQGGLQLLTVEDAEELLQVAFGERALSTRPEAAFNIEANLSRGVTLYEKEGASGAAAVLLGRVLELIEERRSARSDATLYQREELLALWRGAAARTQLGEVALALRYVERAAPLAEALWRDENLDAQSYLGFKGTHALVLRDAFRFEAAERLLETSLAAQRQLRVGKREIARTLGNLGELRTFMGRFDSAEEALLLALSHLEEAYPDEAPRALCYLGNLALARGDVQGALVRYAAGLERNCGVETGAERNETYLRYGQLKALFAAGAFFEVAERASEALSRLDPQRPFPRQMILMLRGRARLATGAREAGHGDLEEAADHPLAVGALLRFALSLAHLHRARALLADDPRAEKKAIVQACAHVREAMAALVDYPQRQRFDVALRELPSALPGSAAALDRALEAIVGHFPY